MSDSSDIIWHKFINQRTKPLGERFPGHYRAMVVETNDPLNMYRVRFKCPEMHNFDLKPEDCPWAVPAHDLGGYRAGRFSHPCIGDWIWITFEKQHPYGPIWTGFANPTRRKLYTYPQVHQITPTPVNKEGKEVIRPNDYDRAYLPKDGRPMAHGWQDRYGTLDIHSSVGFFPVEHDIVPPPKDHDAVQNLSFDQATNKPEINAPDKKYSARITKYGNMMILGDQGYYWKNEFTGNFEQDEAFEIKRWKYYQKLINENIADSNKGGDQRRICLYTRYGHRFEMRDVGWAQEGPIPSESRENEIGPAVKLSKEKLRDERWIKIRSKGGMLIQLMDMGLDPSNDKLIKRNLLNELGANSENEKIYWNKKDARMIRFISRYGYKMVLDDRGSDKEDSTGRDYPRGNGILLKGKRSPAAGDRVARGNPRGHYWEMNENDQANHTTWGTAGGLAIEMNDRYQYTMITASLGKGWSRKWMGYKENEFLRKPTMLANPELTSHHIKLDHENEYIRIKTRANKGPKPEDSKNPSGVGVVEQNQGFEARDGINGDGPWVEMVDCQNRGIWLSKKYKLGIWRSKLRDMNISMDEEDRKITIYNDTATGEIIIYANRNVKIMSKHNIHFQADGNIFFKAKKSILMQADQTKFSIQQNVLTNTNISAAKVFAYFPGVEPGNGAGRESPDGAEVATLPKPTIPSKIEPTDRGISYTIPIIECPREEVEHQL